MKPPRPPRPPRTGDRRSEERRRDYPPAGNRPSAGDRSGGRGSPVETKPRVKPPPEVEGLKLSGEVLEGRNVVVEALRRGRRALRHIYLDDAAKGDDKVTEILEKGGKLVRRVPRHLLDRASQTGVHNGVIADADPLPELSLREVLAANRDPFLVLVDEVQYEHNLGAILRSALGAGVDAVIVPVQRGKGLSPVVHRVSMGGAEAVPLIREGISSSLAEIRRQGILVVGADMDGVPPWEVDLTGPVAMVFGGEDKGLTDPVRKRCDVILGVPLLGNLESLNVSVTAALLMFERQRQLRQRDT